MSWLRQLSLSSRITALSVGAGIILSMIAASAALTAAANSTNVDRLVERISPMRVNAERLLSVALTQQSGATQYATNSQAQYLGQYEQAVTTEQNLYTSSRNLLRGEKELLAQLETAHHELERWRAEVAQPLVDATRANGPDPQRSTLSADQRARFERVEESIGILQRSVGETRNRLFVEVERSTTTLVVLLIAAAAVVLGSGVLLSLLLARLVTRPVLALAGEVRRVARGDYEYRISVSGPPEVERLARDVDAMRRQIASDLTEVRTARQRIESVNQELESKAEELTRSNRDLEQFAYVASHDLQEPLRKVASFCQLLQRRYAGQLDERADQYIHFAVDGAQRMQRLINDLLAFSRIGRMTTGFVDVDLNKVVDDVIAQREPAGTITRDALPMVRGEEPLLAALLNNLVGNSLKFHRPDTAAEVRISAARAGGEWELSVRDNGIGISPEFVDKVFVIFQRLHSKEAYPGTGIGLSISKKIIEYHGGRIWVDTDYRDGTLIRFTLPAVAEVAGPEPATGSQPASDPQPAVQRSAVETRVEEPAQ